MAGREAVYFEVELSDSYACGSYGYCAGFLINVITSELGISGWAFEHGFHQRIWVVDGGEQHAALPFTLVLANDDEQDRAGLDLGLHALVEVDESVERATGGGDVALDVAQALAALLEWVVRADELAVVHRDLPRNEQ